MDKDACGIYFIQIIYGLGAKVAFMSTDSEIISHWERGGVWDAVQRMIKNAGLDPDKLTPEELAPLDHLHGRGVEATREIFERIKPDPEMHLLDIGAGVGGPARLAAYAYGARVTCIDLTSEFCDVAAKLTERTGLSGQVIIQKASALDLPFEEKSFDAAYSQNVSMNIIDKKTFYAEAFRVIRHKSLFVCAEYAEGPGGLPIFPVPWALRPEESHLLKPDEIIQIIESVGFEIIDFQDQSDVMIEFSQRVRKKIAIEGAPLLSPSVLLGDDGVERLKNSSRSIEEKRTIPIQIVCKRD